MPVKKAAAVIEPEPAPIVVPAEEPIRPGDAVYYIEQRGPVPATVQFIYPGNASLRLWVYGTNSIYPKDGVVQGTEPGYWRRR